MGMMRRISLFALLCFAFPYLGYSQFGNESPIPYFRYSVTAGLGANQLYGDLDKRQIGGGVYLRGELFRYAWHQYRTGVAGGPAEGER